MILGSASFSISLILSVVWILFFLLDFFCALKMHNEQKEKKNERTSQRVVPVAKQGQLTYQRLSRQTFGISFMMIRSGNHFFFHLSVEKCSNVNEPSRKSFVVDRSTKKNRVRCRTKPRQEMRNVSLSSTFLSMMKF